jgi:hypothetical protein
MFVYLGFFIIVCRLERCALIYFVVILTFWWLRWIGYFWMWYSLSFICLLSTVIIFIFFTNTKTLQKYHRVITVPKYNGNLVEIELKPTPLTHIHDHSHFHLLTGTFKGYANVKHYHGYCYTAQYSTIFTMYLLLKMIYCIWGAYM